jgi:hypothetical protein
MLAPFCAGPAVLVMKIRIETEGVAQELELSEGRELTVGRLKDNAICIPANSVSRRHAVVCMRNGKVYVSDVVNIPTRLLKRMDDAYIVTRLRNYLISKYR